MRKARANGLKGFYYNTKHELHDKIIDIKLSSWQSYPKVEKYSLWA